MRYLFPISEKEVLYGLSYLSVIVLIRLYYINLIKIPIKPSYTGSELG